MKAVVMYEFGGPEVLKIESRPKPKVGKGEVLIRVQAFGFNGSEMFTRQGHSPDVKLPRVLGIEAVGVIEDAPGGEFHKNDVALTAMVKWDASSTAATRSTPVCRPRRCRL